MDIDLDATLIRYSEFADQLTDETVEEFRKLASPNVLTLIKNLVAR